MTDGDQGSTRAEVRRRKLVDTARKLFIANGFHSTGIAQIARESGIAVGQIYRDFSAKEEIVAAIVESDCRNFMDVEPLHAALAGRDSAALRDWLRRIVDADDDLDGGRLFAEIVAEASRNVRIAAITDELAAELRANIMSALAVLAPVDALAARRQAVADLLMTLSLGLLQHRLVQPELDLPTLILSLRTVIDGQVEELIAAARAA